MNPFRRPFRRAAVPPPPPSVPEYVVRFDDSGASYVDREALLNHPDVIRQFDAGRRIVAAHHAGRRKAE